MNNISMFRINNLHGYKTVGIKIEDNTLVLVGENGAGKTTVLQLLFYILSRQWAPILNFQFTSIEIEIGGVHYVLEREDFDKVLKKLNARDLRHLPPQIRRRVMQLMQESDGVFTEELVHLMEGYGLSSEYFINQLDIFEKDGLVNSNGVMSTLKKINDSLDSQVLYLPTYRRIEQELNLIFKGLDEKEIGRRRNQLRNRKESGAFVELVEFGMKDVASAISSTRMELDRFARENLNELTFGYLGDIVEEKYDFVDLDPIKNIDEKDVDSILNRIQDPILSPQNKENLRGLIRGIKGEGTKDVHSKVISHYFIKLMEFHQELEIKESKIVQFCEACNGYMVDKMFTYNSSDFDFKVITNTNDGGRDIQLQDLSSGEKQIVSLFSHLYLSGQNKYIVLIDEPEMSLSVEWQRKFLTDIRSANFCSGLIAVTHSPFIYENDLRKYAHGLGEFVI